MQEQKKIVRAKRDVYRHELKYLINEGDRELIAQRLKTFATPDKHAIGGKYKIRSLYYDDYWSTAYFEKQSGTADRKKFRVRIYNDKDDFISLECKLKRENCILKRSARLTREEYDMLNAGEYDFLLRRPEIVCQNMYYQCVSRMLRPYVIVDYEREPYVMDAGTVRITFDSNVRSCSSGLDIFNPELPSLYTFEPGKLVMEVKFTEFLPSIVRDVIPPRASELSAVSKFVLCCDKTAHTKAKTINY